MSDGRAVLEASLRDPRLAADDPRHDGPPVSVVVITRDGLHHLRRLFDGLASRTAYRDLEVVVVDNASTDGTLAFLAEDHPFPVRVVANDENRSFSAANNQGIEVAQGELVLICNNDVDPIHPDWLTRLVDPLVDDRSVAMTGPLLVYPPRTAPPGEQLQFPDLTVQSAGVSFEMSAGRVRARNLDAGGDPLAPHLRGTREVAALTAACVLARASDLRAVGGFDEQYFYGSEDWDLSLRLARRGRLLLVGRSVLYHHEYGTQSTYESSERDEYRRRNHTVFNVRWGAPVRRRLLLEHLGADGLLLGETTSTYVVVPDDDPMLGVVAREFAALGWRRWVEDDPRQPVLELTRVGQGGPARSVAALCAALVRSREDAPAPRRANLVIGLDGRHPPTTTAPTDVVTVPRGRFTDDSPPDGAPAADLVAALARHVARPRVGIRNPAPDWDRGSKWGDTHFAASLADAFGRAGIDALQHTHAEWDRPHAQPFDIVVSLRGIREAVPVPGAINVLWIISHADDVTPAEAGAFDLVLVASRQFAEQLRASIAAPVHVMHQAADPRRFRPPHRTLRRAATGVVVVANARWPFRRAPRWLMDLGIDFELYGANWDRFPEHRHLVSDFVPNEELADVYATADVVVADQWDHMAREGFVANRLFDIAASGGFCISDGGPGVREVFGDLVPVYDTRSELGELVTSYLADPGERDLLAHRAMKLVRAEHTFDVRVRQLLELLDVSTSP